MPELKEYISREGLTPTDRGVEARVQEGRRVGAFFNQEAESLRDFGNRTAQEIGGAIRDAGSAAAQYLEHREIRQGIPTYAQLQDDLTSKWNDLAKNSDPNDPSVRQKFLDETLKPAIQNWGDSFQTEGGQKWALSRTNALLDHMYEKTAADDMTRSGQALVTSIRTFNNTQANTAYNDPSSVEHLIGNNEAAVDGLIGTSNLKGVTAGKARTELLEQSNEQIAKAGGIGAIDRNTDPVNAVEKYIQKYSKYLTPAAQEVLRAHARETERAGRADESRARTLANQQRHDVSEQREDYYLGEIYSEDYKRQSAVTAKDISSDYRLLPATKKQLINIVEREAKPETERRISEKTTVDFLRRLQSPDADLQKILSDAYAARSKDPGHPGSLTRADFNEIRAEIAGRKDPVQAAIDKSRGDFFTRYNSTIDPNRDKTTGAGGSALGDQKIYQATQDAKQYERDLQQRGIDPRKLYDPASEFFFGKTIAKYRPTLQEETEFRAREKADKDRKEILAPARPGNFNERFRFDSASGVISKSDYDKLPPGTEFIDGNGKKWRKPAEASIPVSR